MSILIEKFCKKQQQTTKHRWYTDKRNKNSGLYACVECREENSKRHRRKYWLRYLAQKANARKRPDSEKMTEQILQELWNRQDGKCFFTGQPFSPGGSWAASLDRLDAKKGYTKDNIVLSSWIVNHSRGDLEYDEFVQMCSAVVEGTVLKSLLG